MPKFVIQEHQRQGEDKNDHPHNGLHRLILSAIFGRGMLRPDAGLRDVHFFGGSDIVAHEPAGYLFEAGG